MRSPRILARPWRHLHTRSRPPQRRDPPRVRPSFSAPIPWREGVAVPPRTTASGANVLDGQLEDDARKFWTVGSRIPDRRPRKPIRAEGRDRVPKTGPRPGEATTENAASATPEPWDQEKAVAMLEFHGPTFMHERFEELAVRQCRPEGSAATLWAALKEIWRLGLKPRPAFYTAVLAALAVHPDYLLRARVLALMRRDWIEVSPENREHTVLGLLRDGQYEMALDEVEDMLESEIPVPPYLHEILIFALANLGFLPEALTHLSHRTAQHPPPRDDILYFLLDTCAAAQHHATTAHLWRAAAHRLTPSDGTLLNVLNTAARHADPPLALEALRRLSDRRVQMAAHHFEPVVEAYAGAGDLRGALRMLCVMNGAGIRPRRDATRAVFFALRERPIEIVSCVDILGQLGEQYRVPVAAVNVLVEAAVEVGDVATAEDVLSKMGTLTPEEPTQTTFLPFLTLPDPPLPLAINAITLFPHALTLPAVDLARLATALAPHDAGAALAYLRRLDAVHEGGEDAWRVYSAAVRAVAVELARREDEDTWEFLKEVARRCPTVAEEVRELGSKGELE